MRNLTNISFPTQRSLTIVQSIRGTPRINTSIEESPMHILIKYRRELESEFNQVWEASNRSPGQPLGGFIDSGRGYYREYQNGRIYLIKGEGGFYVYGAILERYKQLGGPDSWLGWPTSTEQDFAEGGRATTFENGAIYWWSDTGAIELGNVVVRYTGLFCFGETDDGSDSDEPYLIFGVVPALCTIPPSERRTRIYGEDDDPWGGVDAGDSRYDSIELYRGLPYGLALTTTLMEHDYSNPDKFLKPTQAIVEKAGHAIASASVSIPIFGPAIAVALEALLGEFGDDLAEAINALFGTEDDYIDTQSLVITAKQMVALARAGSFEAKGVHYKLETPILSGDGGSYKATFSIEAA